MPPTTQDPKLLRKPCAECRRLKIKCDRTVPCGNCAKRGVSRVCPDSTMSYSEGRFVLTGTEELHSRIQELSIRVKKLEAALQAAHGTSSTAIKQLLEDGERVHVTLAEGNHVEIEGTEDPEINGAGTMFSMLSIEKDVRTSRMTPSHYSLWYLDGTKNPHHAPSIPEKIGEEMASLFPIELLRIAQGPYEGSTDLREKLLACLPPINLALELVDLYYQNAGSLHNIVPRKLFLEEFWPCVYGDQRETGCISPLGVIFNIFCLGARWHPALPSGCCSPSRFNHLAIIALSQDPIGIAHVEGLYLQAIYLCIIDSTHTKPWVCLGLAVKLAQTLGIDRDCALWKIPEEARQRRRRVFNELHSFDCYMSMLVGRCNVLSSGQYLTPPPDFTPNAPPKLAICEKTYHWKYMFLGQGIQQLLELVLSTEKPATYSATLALDKKLRSYDMLLDSKFYKELGTLPKKEQDTFSVHRYQQQFILLSREGTLLHLHRSFLNRAIVNPTGDPILSKWSISVMAAYQSSCSVIRQVRLMKTNRPEFLQLLVWSNIVLTAVITLGALVIKTPYSSLASVAFQEVQSGCELLEFHYPPDHFLLPVISRLKAAAITAYETRDRHPLMQSATSLPEVKRPIDDASSANQDSDESTPPVATGDLLSTLFDSDHGILGAGFFSTGEPLNPSLGGMNWHFGPPPSALARNPFGLDVPLSDTNAWPAVMPAEQQVQEDNGAVWAELLRQLGSPPPDPDER